MPIRLPKTVRLSPSAQRFHTQVFNPVYDSVVGAINRTPLVVMLWGPRHRSREWSQRRHMIRAELERLGHTAFFSEQLGVPVSAASRKGVEFLQSESSDLIVVVQSLYGVVGGVSHFVEFRLADAKMLLFIDQAAADQNLYARALAEMQTRYNNIDTFDSHEEPTRDTLLKKIVAKVSLMQVVKYRALQSASRWGLRSEDYTFAAHPQGNVQPFRYNLLELYREHRNEIDVLNNPVALFVLALVNQLDRTTLVELSSKVAFPNAGLSEQIAALERAEMLIKTGGVIETTGFGEHFLNGLGFPAAPAVTVVAPRPPVKWGRVTAMATGAGIALATLVLLFMAALYGANITQTQAPLQFAPSRVATVVKSVTPTPTRISAPIATVTPLGR